MPYASDEARHLTARLLVYESGDRISAKEVSSIPVGPSLLANSPTGTET
jgi:hypothetical protein